MQASDDLTSAGDAELAAWKAANRGAWRRRLPFFTGLLGGALLGGIVLAMVLSYGATESARYAAMRANGQEVVCTRYNHGHVSRSAGPCGDSSTGAYFLVFVGLAALAGFGGGFLLGGGKLSSEHMQGLAKTFER